MRNLELCCITRHWCLFVYFLSMGGNFWPGSANQKFTFLFQKPSTSREFCQSTHLFWADMFQKCNFCFITGVARIAKAIWRSLQSQSAVCLTNLFLKRSVKRQAHHISWFNSRFSKLKNRFFSSFKNQELSLRSWRSRCEWLSPYLWVVL